MSLALAVCILTLLRTAIVQASNCTLAPTLRPLPEADIPAQRAALAQLYANVRKPTPTNPSVIVMQNMTPCKCRLGCQP